VSFRQARYPLRPRSAICAFASIAVNGDGLVRTPKEHSEEIKAPTEYIVRRLNMRYLVAGTIASILGLAILGCVEQPAAPKPAAPSAAAKEDPEEIEIRDVLAKLSPEDRALAEKQRFCVIEDESRLGSMGPPIKLDVKGRPVFVCCKGCQRPALADPDKTLARLDALTKPAAK
jgi:hypothetical protein